MKIRSDKNLTCQGKGIRAGKWFTITPEMGEVSWPKEICDKLIAMGAEKVANKPSKEVEADTAE